MSSREIAELTDKRHDNVVRTIQTLYDKGLIALPHFEEVPNPGPGPLLLKQWLVGKRDSYVIVAQLSPEFTARLVDRWQELEQLAAQTPALPQNFAEALRLAADQAEQIEQQRAVIEEQAPKVEAMRVLADAEGSVCITVAAKQLSMKPGALFTWLKSNRWIYRRTDNGPLVAYQPRIDSGYLVHKVEVIEREGKQDKLVESVRVTPKGLAKLAILAGGEA
jgi:phage regulator Rha-like protein